MGKTIKMIALVFLLTLALGLPTMAQYGPPAGYEGMAGPPAGFDVGDIPGGIPAGFDTSDIPSGAPYGAGAGEPSGLGMGGGQGQGRGGNGGGRGAESKKRGLQQLRKGAAGILKGVAQMEKAIAGAEKAGYPVAQDIKDTTAKAKAAAATIQTTDNIEEALVALDDCNAFFDVVEANIEALNMLANFPKILKQATRTLEQLQKNFDKMKAKVARTEMDLSENVSGIQAKIDALRAVYVQAQDLAKAGDAAGAFDKLENEYFEPMQDAYQSVGMLQAALNISTAVKNVDKGIKNAERVITKMKKKKFDTAELQTIVDQSKAKAAELKALVKVKDFDPDAAVAILEELDGLQSDFMDTVDEITDGETEGLGNVTFFNTNAPAMPKEFTAGPSQSFEKPDFGGF